MNCMEYGGMYLRMYILCRRVRVSIKAKASSISCFLEKIPKKRMQCTCIVCIIGIGIWYCTLDLMEIVSVE